MSAVTARLHASVSATCPIAGVSVGVRGNPATVRIDFAAEATPEQRAAAAAVVAGFDWSEQAHQQWEEDQHPERKAVRAAAAQALADNAAYLALSSPTAAQVRQQTDALTRQVSALVRRVVQID